MQRKKQMTEEDLQNYTHNGKTGPDSAIVRMNKPVARKLIIKMLDEEADDLMRALDRAPSFTITDNVKEVVKRIILVKSGQYEEFIEES